ncbi:MAG: type II toxin-antitoxin system HipA family toxin [Gammaproteobacteria bacterium]|nr:type II toxin-antitoxin system HipA family toxin [Gammaproteobacteria bacterium]
MTSERECFVYIMLPGATEFVTAGRFRWIDDGEVPVGQFVYGRSYLERPDAVEFDPIELQLSSEVRQKARLQGFFGAIRDAMPDFWGRRVIERRFGVAELAEFDYLLRSPDDRAGALAFGANVQPPLPRHQFSRTLDLASLQSTADAIVAGKEPDTTPTARHVEELLLLGTSMGGARPKAVVQEGDTVWLAKFASPEDRWNHPKVEHGMLNLARACGLQVADSRVDTVADRDVLLVRRFDRERRGKALLRHRMISALTLLQSGDAVGERDRWSYLLLADEVRRASAAPQDDLRELFARMCFNAATSNIDDHPRNHAMLAPGTSWRLSPAYDLVPSPVLALDRRDLAMACGQYGRQANRANLLSGHGRFLLEEAEASAIFDQITKTVRRRWRNVMQGAGVTEADRETIGRAFLYDGLSYTVAPKP